MWPLQTLLTLSDDLLDGDLVPPDSEAPADEIRSCMTGPGAAAASSSSGTRPRAHQLPARIKELPHDVEALISDEQPVPSAPTYCTNNDEGTDRKPKRPVHQPFGACNHTLTSVPAMMMSRQPRFSGKFPFACQGEPVGERGCS